MSFNSHTTHNNGNNANTNRLLDMLKSATSPPPQPPSSSSSSVPLSLPSAQAQSSLSPPSGSPREPSPAPPPPSLQAVSLQDLFAGLTSPPTINAAPLPSSGHVSPPPVDRTTSLMGILNGIGSSPRVPPSASNGSSSIEKSVNTPSSGSTPGAYGAIGGENASGAFDHRANLLSMFKSPAGNAGSPVPKEPVVHHPTGSTSRIATPSVSSAAQSAQASPARPKETSLPVPNQPVAVNEGMTEAEPATSQPPAPTLFTAPTSTLPSKSIFDFVSPFDAFEKPKPKTPAKKAEPAPAAAPPVPQLNDNVKEAAATPPPAKSPQPEAKNMTPGPVHAQPQRAKPSQLQTPATNEVRQRQVSGTGLNPSGNSKDLGLPWTLNKVVSKGTEGKGPKSTTQHIVIDLSKPNIDGLVNTPGATQIIPTTIMKQDHVAFSKGRSVGLTTNWLAYAMSKGRVRLIDITSGSRLMLTGPYTGQGNILDIAVTLDRVAVLYPDHSIVVFRAPTAWEGDNPETEIILSIRPSEVNNEGLGEVNRLEWVKREGEQQLIVGGSQGVLVVKLSAYKKVKELEMSRLEAESKILRTEGPLAAFCLNHTHQAIGLISSRGELTLYNVANLNRVWNRPLPSSSSKPSAPSSINFVESNILIGRENNTQFDLVQITIEMAVLSTIKFNAPAPSPPHLHFAQVVYDSPRNTLFIAPFSRGTLFGFRYAWKGVPPIKLSETPDAVAFDKLAEYPLEPVLSLALSPKPVTEDAELFFATSGGFSIVHIEKSVCENLSNKPVEGIKRSATPSAPQPVQQKNQEKASAIEVVKPEPVKHEEKVEPVRDAPKATGTPSKSKTASPAVVKEELPSEVDSDVKAVSRGISEDDVSKLLKRSEDKIANNLKQVLNHQLGLVNTRLDSLSGGELAGEIAQRVERSVKASMTSTVQAELKRSMATLSSTFQSDIQASLQSTVPAAVSAAMQAAPTQLEKSLTPAIQRSVASTVQQSVDRSLANALQQSLIPIIRTEFENAVDRIAADLKSELLQVRKDLSPRSDNNQSTDNLVKMLAGSISDLQKQVASLSEQLARQSNGNSQAPPIAPAQAMAAPPPVPIAQHPPPVGLPPAPVLEDAFLSVLSGQNTGGLLALVNDHWAWTETILPNPPGRSSLSQAVILTLLHRLAGALNEINPADQNFMKVLTWEKRVAALLDPRAPEIASFYGRVVPIVQGVLGGLLQGLSRGNGYHEVEGVKGVRAVLETLAGKV